MTDYDDFDTYNGDTEHDMWVDFDNFENTGSPDVFDEPKKFTITVPVAEGKRYKYKFDIRKFGDISVH